MNTQRTALFLMANLGSEVSRLLAARDRGDAVLAESSLDRAKKILNELMALEEMKPRASELAILGEVIEDFVAKPPQYAVRAEEIKNYFMPFTLRSVEEK